MATLKTSRIVASTKYIILAALVFFIALDVWWATNTPSGDTISEATLAYAHKYMSIPVAFGVLMGHLFWPYRVALTAKWVKIWILWAVCAVVVVSDVFDLVNMTPVIPAILFIPVGHYLWPQTTVESTTLQL